MKGRVAVDTWSRCYNLARDVHRRYPNVSTCVDIEDLSLSKVFEVEVGDVLALLSVVSDDRNGVQYHPFSPFDYVFVGFTGGIQLDMEGDQTVEGFYLDHNYLVGISISPNEVIAWIETRAASRGRVGHTTIPHAVFHGGEWLQNAHVDLILGICQMLYADAKMHKTSRGMRLGLRKAKVPRVPKDFYVVPSGSHYAVPRVRRTLPRTPGTSLAYRHDRRAHDRVLVHRGTNLSDEDRERMVARGYAVYDDASPNIGPADTHRLISREHRAREPGEWLAVKEVRVRACLVGPEDAPYVPAVRV